MQTVARLVAWTGICAIVILSVVPASERPVVVGSGLQAFLIGSLLEHVAAFGLTAGAFAVGYAFSIGRLALYAVLYCSAIELLQVPIPTRHARISDFVINLMAACLAMAIVSAWRRGPRKTRISASQETAD